MVQTSQKLSADGESAEINAFAPTVNLRTITDSEKPFGPSVEELEAKLRSTQLLAPIQLKEVEDGRPRLMIHQMVLINFKSYAGNQVIGPFHKVIFCASWPLSCR